MKSERNANAEFEELKKLRRMFHQNPEVGWTEFWTTSVICDRLEELGYTVYFGNELWDETAQSLIKANINDMEALEKAYSAATEGSEHLARVSKMKGALTGAIAHLKCNSEGPAIGFRFDIDALPINESDGSDHLPAREGFASKNAKMHACGHDGHAAIGLGLAKRISENRNRLHGDYYLIFQPAEESGIGVAGGSILYQTKMFPVLDYLIPIHLGIVDTDEIVCGLSFLSRKKFKVVFRGEASHASAFPQKGKNALLAACTAVTSLYGIARHTDGSSRIGVGSFKSPSPTNVISDLAEFEVELRSDNEEVADFLLGRAVDIVEGAARMFDIQVEMGKINSLLAVKNSKGLKEQIKQAAIRAGIPEGSVVPDKLVMGSEDATFLMKKVQDQGGEASYLCVGSKTYGGHHNPRFDFDETKMLNAVNILWETAVGLGKKVS